MKTTFELDQHSQRDSFLNEIYEIAQTNKDIVMISADMGAPSLDRFRKDFPHKFLNAGISEQNAILLGAGLALEKKRVYVYAIASFLTLNCIEKIRVQCAMMKLPLVLLGVGAGLSYPDSGPTHHLIEDLSILRSLPNLDIYNVSDATMAKKLARESLNFTRPTYIRLERQKAYDFYSKKNLNLHKGFEVLHEGKGSELVISSGHILHSLLELSSTKDFTLVDLFRLPFDESALCELAKRYSKITVVEEHVLTGGLSSALLEVFNDHGLHLPLKRLGMKAEKGYCYEYGGREELRRYYGLDQESLSAALS